MRISADELIDEGFVEDGEDYSYEDFGTEYEPTPTWTVRFNAHTGLAGLPKVFEDREEARAYVAKRIRRYRKDGAVDVVEKGKVWELLEPEDCFMVPDSCGILSLTERWD